MTAAKTRSVLGDGRDTHEQPPLEDAAARAMLGFWQCDPQTSEFRASEIVHEIFGLAGTPDIDLETFCRSYVADSAGALGRAIDLVVQNGSPFSLVSEIQTPSGQRKWVRTQGQLATQPGSRSRHVCGTVQDISEIRALDRVAQESEKTLNRIEEITHLGHFSVNLVDGSIFHSDEIKRIFGYEPSEYALSVEEAINAYHPDDRDEVVRLFNRAAETGEGYQFDLRVVQPSGEIRHVHSEGYTEQDEHGKVTRVAGVFQDITERVLAERALRESEASLKNLVNSVSTAIVVHGKDGEILLSNQMADRLLAPLATDIVGRTLTDPAWRFISEAGQDMVVDDLPVSRILKTRAPVENQVLGLCAGRETIWLLVNGVPILDEHGAPSMIVMSFVDITEHKGMEERLHQAEKMKAIGQLAGGVAHDFNNQLMVMLNFAEVLKDSLQESSAEYACVEGIISGVSRSAELTKQLLAFARKGKYVVRTVDIDALISEVVSMARHSFDKKIEVQHHANAATATIAGDTSQLQNALLNMALNSRDAMPDGGQLVFTTEQVTLDEHLARDMELQLEPGECLRVTISDTGCGMDDETQKHIFEPFYTTKGQGKGTGMGMASVYGTIENHHGAIDVRSQVGVGTTVTLHFPLIFEQSVVLEETASKPDDTGARILIVDDEEAVASSLSMMLERKGYETTTCATGRDALHEFQKSWRQTDLVLLDMIMPEMGGAETFCALKAIDPDVKVVLISGYSFEDEATRINDEGIAGFLVKPVGAQDLLDTIAEVLGIEEARQPAAGRTPRRE